MKDEYITTWADDTLYQHRMAQLFATHRNELKMVNHYSALSRSFRAYSLQNAAETRRTIVAEYRKRKRIEAYAEAYCWLDAAHDAIYFEFGRATILYELKNARTYIDRLRKLEK